MILNRFSICNAWSLLCRVNLFTQVSFWSLSFSSFHTLQLSLLDCLAGTVNNSSQLRHNLFYVLSMPISATISFPAVSITNRSIGLNSPLPFPSLIFWVYCRTLKHHLVRYVWQDKMSELYVWAQHTLWQLMKFAFGKRFTEPLI